MSPRDQLTLGNRQDLPSCMREIFDAEFWKRTRALAPKAGHRWTAPHLLYTALALCLSSEPTQRERFETARQFSAAFFDKRRRPGKTYTGFTAAWRTQGLVLGGVARARLQAVTRPHFAGPAWDARAFAVDGSRVGLPHSAAHAQAFGETRIKHRTESAPQLLVVAAVQLRSQVLYDWEILGGNDSEPEGAAAVIGRLPPGALIVKDAGMVGYTWLRDVLRGGRHLLMRVAGSFKLWAEAAGATLRAGGTVWLGPPAGTVGPPLRWRLLRVPGVAKPCWSRGRRSRRRRTPLYLLTDLSPQALSTHEAGRLYRARWGASEIGFRRWKQTLHARKMAGYRPEVATRECFYSLLGLQLLQALPLLSAPPLRAVASVAQLWLLWRSAAQRLRERRATAGFAAALRRCVQDSYRRRRAKQRRRPPRDKRPAELRPPQIRRLTGAVKRLWHEEFQWVS